jgi:hypothetical protein
MNNISNWRISSDVISKKGGEIKAYSGARFLGVHDRDDGRLTVIFADPIPIINDGTSSYGEPAESVSKRTYKMIVASGGDDFTEMPDLIGSFMMWPTNVFRLL